MARSSPRSWRMPSRSTASTRRSRIRRRFEPAEMSSVRRLDPPHVQWGEVEMTAMTEARAGSATQVTVPDIGDFKDVPIIEILVKEGDAINAEDPLLTLESDKATMEVPAPSSGTVEQILVKVGDKVSEGTPILTFKGGEGAMTQPPSLVTQ